jgi:hypothetical protein
LNLSLNLAEFSLRSLRLAENPGRSRSPFSIPQCQPDNNINFCLSLPVKYSFALKQGRCPGFHGVFRADAVLLHQKKYLLAAETGPFQAGPRCAFRILFAFTDIRITVMACCRHGSGRAAVFFVIGA